MFAEALRIGDSPGKEHQVERAEARSLSLGLAAENLGSGMLAGVLYANYEAALSNRYSSVSAPYRNIGELLLGLTWRRPPLTAWHIPFQIFL